MPPPLSLALLAACASDPLPAPPAPPIDGPLGFRLGGPDGVSPDAGCAGAGAAPAVSWEADAGWVAWRVSRADSGDALWMAWDQPADAGGRPAGTRPGEFPPAQGLAAGGPIGWAAPCGAPALDWTAWLLSEPLRAPPTRGADALADALDAVAAVREAGRVAFAPEAP